RRGIRRALESARHTVWEAHDGAEGVGSYLDHQPDLVIVDLFMPEKDGLETIQELKKLNQRARIIGVSGSLINRDCDFLRVAKHFGAKRVLTKPISNDVLIEAVESALIGAE